MCQSGNEPYKGETTKVQQAMDSSCILVRIFITEGTKSDCKEFVNLIQGRKGKTLSADRGFISM